MSDKFKANYDLGIIGGMGSEATVEVFRRLVSRTYHTCDQDLMRICILNDAIIPDRTKAIKEGSSEPLDYINYDIKKLEEIGVNYFIIPCNTAHYFENGFSKNIKFISMIDEALKHIKLNYKDKSICLLATSGTNDSKVYFDNKNAKGLDFIKLDKTNQDKVMNVITLTKEGNNKDENFKLLKEVVDSVNKDNVLFVLACTELSLYKERLTDYLVIDAMDILVDSAILKCGFKLKEEK